MPNQVDGALLHSMSGSELSPTNRILPTANIRSHYAASSTSEQPALHRYLGNVLLSTHRQAQAATSPIRVAMRSCLARFYQQEAQ